MNFARALLILIFVTIGGIFGNLFAAWLQQDVWHNSFTWPRVVGTATGLIVVSLLLAWLDRKGQAASKQALPSPALTQSASPTGVQRKSQSGKPIFRMEKGKLEFGNFVIRRGSIEVGEQASLPSTASQVARNPVQGSVKSQQRQQLIARQKQLNAALSQVEQQIRYLRGDLQRASSSDAKSILHQRYIDLIAQRKQLAAQLAQLDAILEHTGL